MCERKGNLTKLNYMQIKQLIDRKVVENKWGALTQREIQNLFQELHDHRQESKLDQGTAEREMDAMQKQIQCYNVEQLGSPPMEREDSTMRILVCQMGGCSSVETREIKILATERLIRKYDINLCLFMELNYNWAKVKSSANLASWFTDNKRKTRCITAHNTKEDNTLFGKHQPGGMGMLCQHKYLQYAQRPTANPRGLGGWCSWPFFCNPTHFTRIVVAYQPCASKTEGLKTVYQQHMQYIQLRGLPFKLFDLFDNNLCKQVKEWRGRGIRVLIMMDFNDHPLQNKFYTKLQEQNTELEEFTHKCWGPSKPYTHHSGKTPINGRYKTPKVGGPLRKSLPRKKQMAVNLNFWSSRHS
jgi:hypothetical protein